MTRFYFSVQVCNDDDTVKDTFDYRIDTVPRAMNIVHLLQFWDESGKSRREALRWVKKHMNKIIKTEGP